MVSAISRAVWATTSATLLGQTARSTPHVRAPRILDSVRQAYCGFGPSLGVSAVGSARWFVRRTATDGHREPIRRRFNDPRSWSGTRLDVWPGRTGVDAAGRRLVAVASALVVLLLSTLASAQREWDTGLIGGICGVGEGAAVWERARACLGARGDLVWGRSAPGEFAAGGFVGVGTAGFRDVVFEGGPTTLLPLGPVWTGMLSVGPVVRRREAQWEPGVAGWAFVGRRPFNYHGKYAMTWGFVVGYDRSFGALDGSTLTMGVQLDGLVLAMPVLFAVEAARGRRSD